MKRENDNVTTAAPPIWMKRGLACRIMHTIGALPPESGGILLGPVGSDLVTDFYFDASARCTGATYAPDHLTLQRKMCEHWLPNGLDMKGFAHSHPGGFDRLSEGDLRYIGRLLAKNPDMNVFAAPIIVPEQFRVRAIVVLRDRPDQPRLTHFRFF
jgi:proteasome lid subunit RPN8/RPN11